MVDWRGKEEREEEWGPSGGGMGWGNRGGGKKYGGKRERGVRGRRERVMGVKDRERGRMEE